MRKILTLLIMLSLSSFAWASYDGVVEEFIVDDVDGRIGRADHKRLEAGFKKGSLYYQVQKKAQPAPTDGKVEVIEFFSYGCPHCYRFEPHIEKWKESKPDNVEFIHVPAVFNKNWEALAALYYAAEVLGVEEKMHPVIFEAMHGKGKKVRSVDDLKVVFEVNGISGEKLEQALSSFAVNSKTRRAKSMTEAYGIQSVPTVVVQGKYRVNATLANGHQNVFKVVDHLAENVKKDAQK